MKTLSIIGIVCALINCFFGIWEQNLSAALGWFVAFIFMMRLSETIYQSSYPSWKRIRSAGLFNKSKTV